MRIGDFKFDRVEAAGSLGDLGTLLPLALGMILLNGVSAVGLFFMVGLFYILAGAYYRIPMPVQPMKVIGAYAIASYAVITPSTIYAAALLVGVLLLLLGVTGLIELSRYVPKTVVRGVQLSVGTLLLVRGLEFILAPPTSELVPQYQHALVQLSIAGLSAYTLLGLLGLATAYLLLENRKAPAALILVLGGFVVGFAFQLPRVSLGLHLPEPIFLTGLPSAGDFATALFLLVLPQIPMTLGNAVIAQHDLARSYFGKRASRVTYRALATSQGLANLGSFLLQGMPMCHGAGGLAAHYRFGARTAGNNVIIGAFFLAIALLFGEGSVEIIKLLPFSVLGVLLFIAGAELMTMIRDLRGKREFYVPLVMLGITLVSNLAWAFASGLVLAYLLKYERIKV
ncbi:MAG: sulfate permease [Euryarchaeota archaeon]|nr:sulfate permease [Euryarchaeota archaeon]